MAILWAVAPVSIPAAEPAPPSKFVVTLDDGTKISADRVERNELTGEWTAIIERSGIQITRKLKDSEVRTVRAGQERRAGKIEIAPARGQSETWIGREATINAASHTDANSETELFTNEFRRSTNEECYQPQTYPGRIIGVRDDPLSAYSDTVTRVFPHGVPLSEVECALELMRTEKARNVLAPPFIESPNNGPQNGLSPGEHEGNSAPPKPGAMPPAPIQEPHARRNSVEAVLVDVHPVNSQGRIDWDSLLIEVQAVDELGRAVPVSGTLQATLWGRKQQLVRTTGESLLEEYGSLTKLAEWTRNLQSTTGTVIASNGNVTAAARFVVPLSRPLPEHNLQLAPFGDLHVRLILPGEGVFEATQSGVPLRKFSLVRARNVIERGSVILPGESTTDNPSARGSLQFNRPTSGPDRSVLTIEP